MLKIRKEQIRAFRNDIFRMFENRMVAYLKTHFSEQTKKIQEQELRRMIRKGTFRARKYKVTLEPDVCCFLECMMTYGIDFDSAHKTTWAGKILRDENMTGREKMDRIVNYEISMLSGE